MHIAELKPSFTFGPDTKIFAPDPRLRANGAHTRSPPAAAYPLA
jgi:hypothetical protein